MRKFCIILLLSGIIILMAIGVDVKGLSVSSKNDYIRIHIRANSDYGEDQSVKYLIKDSVVKYLTPLVVECESKNEVEEMLKANIRNIEEVANCVLRDNGYKYISNAKLEREKFPTRVYDGYTLYEGVYDALIIRLGEGKGENWWCVIYPPLCFVGDNNSVIYKSKILEIIEKWKNRT